MDAFGNPLKQSNDFELHEFIDDQNFDQFIDLIRGENEDPFATFDCRVISGCCDDSSTTPDSHLFDLSAAESTEVTDHNNFVLNSSTLSSLKIGGDVKEGDHYDEDNDGNDASGAARTTTIIDASSKKPKGDHRSRTLISEQKRRGKMKEKLYQLRALVPNITKMDKASLVGDAVSYVQELQTTAKNLKAEIADLEASSGSSENWNESIENTKNTQIQSNSTNSRKKIIMQMDVFQVEERGFYLKLVSNKGEGVAASLYEALESLTSFNVQNSNLVAESERFVLTFTLNAKDNDQISMQLPNLKLWVANALLNQGFQVLITPLSA
ncbi:hypothetical protein CISIN_1g042465mg [Citrus sinensis]|uniref:BHLH domain-containing protein n=1 Tax=Citrus sinensis TaxID=2711 RepID=A0A067FAR6_CITSI|nr:hypothetical protein CISIN_1g042465mg [Citrus sinensis]